MLKKLQDLPRDQTLVAHSGVQFVDYGFRIDENLAFSRMFLEKIGGERNGQPYYVLRQIENSRQGAGLIDSETLEPISSNATYSVRLQQALEAYDGVWLPAPYLKRRGLDEQDRETFEHGPTNWARMRVTQVGVASGDPGAYTHRLTIAFDTRPEDAVKGNPYVCPVPEDVRNESHFQFAPHLRDNSWFIYEPWVTGWLKDELKRSLDAKRVARIPRRQDGADAECAYWSFFVVLLQGIAALVDGRTSNAPLGQIHFLNTFSSMPPRHPIDVDLVLDIGNSRTCGVLIETGSAAELNFSNATVIELRDISRPHLAYQEPFRSHVEFAPAEFGNTYWALAGGGRAFNWLSLVRVGPEALRLFGQSSGAEGDTGLSGPKRYLWDERENKQSWRFNVAETRHRDQTPVFGDLLLFLTQEGDALSLAGPDARTAMEPKFSRASMFTFMVMELLLQAVMQINSVDYRAGKKDPHVHRRLRRVLFTIPTATPIVELSRYQKRCQAAVRLLWESCGWNETGPGYPKEPEVIIAYDEATCTQVVYLYNEIIKKFGQKSKDFVSLVGERRHGSPAERLRVASIDIGGGTTDLMVVTYELEPKGNALNPRQNFREGFRKAGDDILEAIISVHVLKAIGAALARSGMPDPDGFLQGLMSDSGKNARLKQLRKLFVTRVLVPIALHVLSQYETVGTLGEPRDPVKFSEIFALGGEPPPHAVAYFEETARRQGAADFSLGAVEFDLDFGRLDTTIVAVLGDIIRPMCEVIHRLDCDALLVSGRPSRLPVIRDLILRYLPTAPHRVVFMHEYRVGNWYPFAGRLGVIEDPKTTVVVGALLCALAENLDIPDFSLRRGGFTIESTANYIGRLLPRGDAMKPEDVVFAREGGHFRTESTSLLVDAPIFIGFRQLPIERWPATPLFFLDIVDVQGAKPYAESIPWTLTFRRDDPDETVAARQANPASEMFWVDQIVDRDGDQLDTKRVDLRLQTLRNPDGYWLDTGIVTLR
jgi:hypothetical protein